MASAQASSARPRALGASAPVARIRWDRLGRVAMLCLLRALLYLYVSAGIRIYSTWHQARGDSAQLATLEREHRLLSASTKRSDGGAPSKRRLAGWA